MWLADEEKNSGTTSIIVGEVYELSFTTFQSVDG